nr:immunoglobulin light chain junction region [Macaca mulatta]MOX77945.1 immunoglobulin light chain junction region [Macaca mulatta]MOX78007.1 immunoglobulin light chain junction region [Macaca mulatta]MOX79031.1 immunoglobulin light chain junction region [Macaca mulatta]MOX79655.1 immunoglobulin light chain junction region [Macaca mulatta]
DFFCQVWDSDSDHWVF